MRNNIGTYNYTIMVNSSDRSTTFLTRCRCRCATAVTEFLLTMMVRRCRNRYYMSVKADLRNIIPMWLWLWRTVCIEPIPTTHFVFSFFKHARNKHNPFLCVDAAQRSALPAGGRDEVTPACRNQLQATKNA